jgi:hypothetical protein
MIDAHGLVKRYGLPRPSTTCLSPSGPAWSPASSARTAPGRPPPAFFVGQALISGHAPHAALGDPGVARAVVGAGLVLTALAVLSVAAGTLLRHPAAAIAAMIAVLFVLPGIAQALPDLWRNPVTEF